MSDGFTCSMWPSAVCRSDSAARNTSSWVQPVRSARSRIWPADSSPDRYSARRPDSRPAMDDLEQQRRLADAGIAGQQRHRAGDEAAAENPVELTDPGREVPGRAGIDRADGDGGRARCDGAVGRRARDRGEDGDLVDRAPAAAVRTPADPLGGDVLALRTAVLRTRLGTDLCHVPTVSVGTDRTVPARLSGRPCRLRRPPRPRASRRGASPAEIGTLSSVWPERSKVKVNG